MSKWNRTLTAKIETALKKSGWEIFPNQGEIHHYEYQDQFLADSRQKLSDQTDEHLDLIDKLMDVLGIRDEYPDRTETIKSTRDCSDYGGYAYFGYRHYTEPYEFEVVHRGASKFIEDVEAASSAAKSEDAVARIRSALAASKRTVR